MSIYMNHRLIMWEMIFNIECSKCFYDILESFEPYFGGIMPLFDEFLCMLLI